MARSVLALYNERIFFKKNINQGGTTGNYTCPCKRTGVFVISKQEPVQITRS